MRHILQDAICAVDSRYALQRNTCDRYYTGVNDRIKFLNVCRARSERGGVRCVGSGVRA